MAGLVGMRMPSTAWRSLLFDVGSWKWTYRRPMEKEDWRKTAATIQIDRHGDKNVERIIRIED